MDEETAAGAGQGAGDGIIFADLRQGEIGLDAEDDPGSVLGAASLVTMVVMDLIQLDKVGQIWSRLGEELFVVGRVDDDLFTKVIFQGAKEAEGVMTDVNVGQFLLGLEEQLQALVFPWAFNGNTSGGLAGNDSDVVVGWGGHG